MSGRAQEPSGSLDVLLRRLAQYRSGVQVGIDVGAWALALTFALGVRLDFSVAAAGQFRLGAVILVAAALQSFTGFATGLYLGRRRFGSFEEVAILVKAVLLVTAATTAINLYTVPDRLVPLSVTLAGGVTAVLLMAAARYFWRSWTERRRRPSGDVHRVLVFGAGEAAAQVVPQMLADPRSPYLPVAALDDDPTKRRHRIKTVEVVGDRSDLAAAAERFAADTLLIAIPTADADLIRAVTDAGQEAGLLVKIVPSVAELFDGRVGVEDIRSVDERDLLGRHEIDLDLQAIAGYLSAKRVLVTGAGGSIGAELCRQIARFAPDELLLADRDESALHALQVSLNGRASLDEADVVLCDIRDAERIDEIFAHYRPEVVFHAAALKHVTALEAHPAEAVKTNVFGTLHVLQAAARHGVERFVNVSTDKAANPANMLGLTKRLAEQLTAHFALGTEGTYLSVRFGNVLGSRGSVLTVFRAQVEVGGPITVTHPDTTRYFMTVEEACQLVIQAAGIGTDGEALVLDMGRPVRIADVARRIAATADPPVRIEYTGLRPGEKLHEELLADGEVDARPIHPLVSHVGVRPIAPDHLAGLIPNGDHARLRAALVALVDPAGTSRHSAV